MPKPFVEISVEEFAELLARFPFTRKITSVHMHHTWIPDHASYRGLATIEAMWRFHTKDRGWSDIAQHISISPSGTIWTGRNWNRPPASASGFNGNSTAGPFMFETIGNFDVGRDRLEGAQRDAVLRVIALVLKRFGLEATALKFHNEMSSKTCPGSAVKRADFLKEVEQALADLDAREAPRAAPGPFDESQYEATHRALEILQTLSRDAGAADPGDAEPPEELAPAAARFAAPRAARGDEPLTPAELRDLRPHVVNLNQGRFSSDGAYSTSEGDVDAIFDQHLAAALKAARDDGRKLRLLFFAHGGLVKEASGLRIAQKHVSWWMRNKVYPIYFVWETGLFETLGQLLRSARQRALPGGRDIWDYTTDPIVEAFARQFGGPKIWSGMKRSARQASDPDGGGARYVAQRLAGFCQTAGDDLELHAAGHSAGSIFHAHFLPAALDEAKKPFRTVHFLAPAIRSEVFLKRLKPRLGNGVDRLTLFTMEKDYERADHCAKIYRKSLLYLIHHALENEERTPILGLDETLRSDAELRRIFALDGGADARGEVVWSVTDSTTGRYASTSTSHGGFDDDAPTMESVLRRVLDVGDTAAIEPFPAETSRQIDEWAGEFEWPGLAAPSAPVWAPAAWPSSPAGASWGGNGHAVAPAPAVATGGGGEGRRRALCVGVNDYPDAPLSGCVADARMWESALGRLGFATATLLDSQATRREILGALEDLVRSSRAGDVVAFQFSGHGTTLRDESGDETGGNNPGRDEAIVPYDYGSGAYVVDDDIAAVFRQIPPGVSVTCFIDCCHSGTISRFGVGLASTAGSGARVRARFMRATPEMQRAHEEFRAATRAFGRSASSPGEQQMPEVLFSACRDYEVAYESDGQGDFTRRAVPLLEGATRLTNEEFEDRVVAAFGANPRQNPELFCAPSARSLGLLAGLAADGRATDRNGRGLAADPEVYASLLREAAARIERSR